MHRILVAHTPLNDAWWATRLMGTEALSELYTFRLGLKSKNQNIDCQALVGEVCSVDLEAQDGIVRRFSGQIVQALAVGKHGKHWAYELVIAPKLWHASRRSDFKIWQNLTVKDIADEMLGKNAINYEWRLKNSYKTWEYLVQYNETDLGFLSRLFEHEGIYYWFEHGAAGETLILGDHFSTHEPFGGYGRIPFYPAEEMRAEDHYYSWRAAREPEPGRFKHRDYDFKKPSTDLTTEFADPRGHLFDQYEIYAYPGNYIETGDGSAYAAVRLEAWQQNQDTIELEGHVRGAIPGCRFELYKHPRGDQNRELVITRAAYDIENNDYDGAGGPDSGARYHVKIAAIPASRQFRAPLISPKPRTRGPETAVVVGPPGSEIHTDKYGRVKVHFHWDRYGQKDGNDSRWIRVAYPWAGTNFGSIHIPRVGQEVIVDFEHGDPDRPIITGRVYNAEQMPPWDLPTNKTQSGILTRSSQGGTPANANALRFEDAKGEEQVWLHAERNQDIEVEHNETHWVGQDRKKTIDRDETTVVHRHRTETVDGNEKITIHQHRKKTVDLTETDFIGIAKTETVGVANIDTVGATRMTNVGGAFSLNVGALMNTLVGRQQSTQVGSAKLLTVGKSYEANIGETMKFNVGQSIELICGVSRITLTSEGGVYLQGVHIEINGQAAVNADAGLMQLNCGATQSPPGSGSGKEQKIDEKVEAPKDEIVEEEPAPPPRHEDDAPDFDAKAFVLGSGAASAIVGKAEAAASGLLGGAASGILGGAAGSLLGGAAGGIMGAASGIAGGASGILGKAEAAASGVMGQASGVMDGLGGLNEAVNKVGGLSGIAGNIPTGAATQTSPPSVQTQPGALEKLGVHGFNPQGKL